jgi:hypothetical protein
VLIVGATSAIASEVEDATALARKVESHPAIGQSMDGRRPAVYVIDDGGVAIVRKTSFVPGVERGVNASRGPHVEHTDAKEA